MSIPAALAPLAAFRQFVPVLLVPKEGKPGKTDKLPVDYRTYAPGVNAHDAAVWTDYDTAERVASSFGVAGCVGFVLTAADPFFCLDIDGALTPSGWSPLAAHLCARLPGTVIEISQSGVGLHIWGVGRIGEHAKKNVPLGIELYTELRFIALGTSHVGAIAGPCEGLLSVAAEFFPPRSSGAFYEAEGPCEGWRGPEDDAELIRRALKSRSMGAAFGTRASFADLWDADPAALARAYPTTDSTNPYDASSADAALAQHLAFWTGRDVARIERLMRQSKLARSKWDDRDDYLVERTIKGACGRQVQILQDKAPEPSPLAVAAPVALATPAGAPPQQREVEGTTFLSAQAQIELFRGCVYVTELHRILVPGGLLLNEGKFRATYGGYTFAMDAANERTTRNAWEAFTESQVLRPPRADGTCFRPDMAPAGIVHDAGRSRVNVWWPVDVPAREGDPSPFLRHLEKLLPDARDRQILLSYMAACVQYPGVKFQWAPLIQGVEGNGKTLLSRCVAEAIGKRYVHWPKASKIAKQFNAWLFGRLLYCVEDIHTPDGQADVIEELKPMITGGDGIEIEGKGVDQVSAEICGNFMFNSNHKTGLRKTKNDRRFAVFYCAQQEAEDLLRDGMAPEYHTRIYDWLRSGGYAVVTHFLRTWAIPDEFNPATACQRAPVTSSTEAAIENGRGRIEQEILESVEQGVPGFCGGWVSSMAVDRLLEKMGRAGAIPLARRRDLLKSLGYDWHPHLEGGRTNNVVSPDGGKPRLFTLRNHAANTITDAASIARAYAAAQGIK